MTGPSVKQLTIPAERIGRWLDGFAERHGRTITVAGADVVVVTAADGATAHATVPFPPLDSDDAAPAGGLVAHVQRDRRVGVILVRRGGYAAGVFEGRRLLTSKVGSRHVQGRTAAGGQSQQRFARRRQKQAREAFEAAADVVARVVLPAVAELDAVIVGGDRAATIEVLGDRRLAPLAAKVVAPHLDVPDPRLVVLRQAPDLYRSVRITLTEP